MLLLQGWPKAPLPLALTIPSILLVIWSCFQILSSWLRAEFLLWYLIYCKRAMETRVPFGILYS